MKSLCLEGKITEKHAEQIRQILSNAKEEGEQKTGKAYMDGFDAGQESGMELGCQETLKKVIEIVKEHDPAHGTGTGKNYWGNTLLAALTKELNQHD